MDLSIITVTWNGKDRIGEQIRSVQAGCKDLSFEEIISDNGSTDGTVEYIREQFPDVYVIENGKNLGFGAANNRGVKRARGEFLLFLNPDMRVEEGSLDTIVNWMRTHDDVGIVSPKLLDENGEVNWDATPRRFPKVWEQLALLLKLPHIFPNMLNTYHMKDFDPEQEQDVDSVRGSFMLMRRSVVEKLGWAFDPRYFIWYEDVDICREVQQMGLRVIYSPVISCVDYVGQSFKKQESVWKQKQFTKSMVQYFQKWEPGYKSIWITAFRPVGIGIVWLMARLKK